MTTVERRVHVVKEVPHMADDDTADLVLGHDAVHNEAKGHQHPGKIGRGEHQQAEEAQAGLGVAATPDVDEAGGEGGAEEGQGEEGRQAEERCHGVEQQPGEVSRGPAGGFLEEARVSLQKEDMEEEIEIQRTEV